MTSADNYRALAADCAARAKNETDPATKAEWLAMGTGYRRLAEQADRNAATDLVYETPRPQHQNQAQQQQQPQPTKDTGDQEPA